MFDIRKIQEQVLFDAVRRESDAETAETVVYGADGSAGNEDNAAWVNSAMRRLTDRFDFAAAKKIRMACQCGYGMEEKLRLVEELIAASSDLEEFGSSARANEAGLYYRNGTLYLQFEFCPCPMLTEVERLESRTWCQCSAGYSKVLFEKAFGCEVEVELQKSIKAGDDVCLMTIAPRNPVTVFRKEK